MPLLSAEARILEQDSGSGLPRVQLRSLQQRSQQAIRLVESVLKVSSCALSLGSGLDRL